jgi:hypothetical protein
MSSWKRQATLAAAGGLAFLVLFGAGFFYFSVLATAFYPSPFGPEDDILAFFADNRGGVRTVSFLYALAATCLLGFASFFAGLAERSAGEMGALPALVLSGGAGAGWEYALIKLSVLLQGGDPGAVSADPILGPLWDSLVAAD